ncbi:hypothetical protein F1188_09105 [Roseospira marina]|uniref:Uncharacterized protein n=1 Tax=Roseospira marina TaxID=140057 RepID=A0A5M6IDD7_9PROT|nr:hypothetical protein [Roseospira marina]KAA5605769.1 hypothetical protein F1188_09105 [Roseospira marina]MBB4313576.1 Na+/glutamate symporter [Roseospira marina]MBB5086738.1 Na+/glutamate symporter [Roseospira marina]
MMTVDRNLVASDAPHVQLLAQGFGMPPVLASVWTEMTLAGPHGTAKVHDMLVRCVHNAESKGDAALAASGRRALATFDTRTGVVPASTDDTEQTDGPVH